MKSIYSFADMGTDCLNGLSIGKENTTIENTINIGTIEGSYRVRIIVEFVQKKSIYPTDLFGKKISELSVIQTSLEDKENLILKNKPGNFSEIITVPYGKADYEIAGTLYQDVPANPNGIFDVIIIPTNILTLHLLISGGAVNENSTGKLNVQHYFDGYSYLGFFLTDLTAFKEIVHKKYGNSKVDLVNELANATLVDELFAAGIFIITWGINPFAYPVYSCEDKNLLEPILGEPFEVEGLYPVKEDIKKLSLIPGYKLNEWPSFADENWPQIELYGSGPTVCLKPYSLRDKDGSSAIPSFVLYRQKNSIQEAAPLLNINLLD